MNQNDSVTTEETLLTVGGSVAGSLFSHVFCCGLLPLALNASATAILGSISAQIGMAVLTTFGVASLVTLFERHRHNTACKSDGHCGCTPDFNFKKHFLRNLAIGVVTYSFFWVLTHVPNIHAFMEKYFGI